MKALLISAKKGFQKYDDQLLTLQVKLRLPICEIYLLFCSLVYSILPFTDVRNFSERKQNKINKRSKKLKNFADR